MEKIYLGIGTNLGNKEENLKQSIDLIGKRVGKVLSVSSFYASEAWGFDSTNNFLNATLLIHSSLSPAELLAETQAIEREMGRKKKSDSVYVDRIIDIDILLYGNLLLNEPDIQIPHPLMHKRDFVLKPLAEIAAGLQHPRFEKSIQDLVEEL